MLNVETIFFVTIHADLSQNLLCCHYAVLAQNLFYCDLRTFVWTQIYSEIVLVEKKGQISVMVR